MTLCLHDLPSINWQAVAVLSTAFFAIQTLRQHSQTLRESVRPVFWLEAARIEADGTLRVLARNMGAGPALNVQIKIWIIEVDHLLSIDEQQAEAKARWPRLPRTLPTVQMGRPIGAHSRAELVRRERVNIATSHALLIYTYEAVDVHGRTHTGPVLKRRWRRAWLKEPLKPGTLVLEKGEEPDAD